MPPTKHSTSGQGSGHRYPPELKERAVRMVDEAIKESGQRHGVVTRIAVQLGLGSETLRGWVKVYGRLGGPRVVHSTLAPDHPDTRSGCTEV